MPKGIPKPKSYAEIIKLKEERLRFIEEQRKKKIDGRIRDQSLLLLKEIQKDPYLNSTARLLLIIIIALDNGPLGCHASNLRLAKMVGCSASTVSSQIRQLKDLGYITHNKSCMSYGGRLFTRYVRADLKRGRK